MVRNQVESLKTRLAQIEADLRLVLTARFLHQFNLFPYLKENNLQKIADEFEKQKPSFLSLHLGKSYLCKLPNPILMPLLEVHLHGKHKYLTYPTPGSIEQILQHGYLSEILTLLTELEQLIQMTEKEAQMEGNKNEKP